VGGGVVERGRKGEKSRKAGVQASLQGHTQRDKNGRGVRSGNPSTFVGDGRDESVEARKEIARSATGSHREKSRDRSFVRGSEWQKKSLAHPQRRAGSARSCVGVKGKQKSLAHPQRRAGSARSCVGGKEGNRSLTHRDEHGSLVRAWEAKRKSLAHPQARSHREKSRERSFVRRSERQTEVARSPTETSRERSFVRGRPRGNRSLTHRDEQGSLIGA
jgi:hypothetical protein